MNKKFFIICILILSIVISCFTGCKKAEDNNIIIDVNTVTEVPVPTLPGGDDVQLESAGPFASDAPFDISASPFTTATPVPDSTALPTPRPSELPSGSTSPVISSNPSVTTAQPNTGSPVTAYPSNPSVTNPPAPVVTYSPDMAADYSVFNNCAFVGNSIFEGLHLYGVITQGSFFTRVGLNLLTVYTQTTTNGSKPVIDELNTGSYQGVILMFGQNELGWPNPNTFVEKYEKLIKDVKSRQPNAQVFITGLPPVSKAASAKNANGVNNTAIAQYNNQLMELALRLDYCHFIFVPEVLTTDGGALPADASGDGIHLNMTYSRLWADHICKTVMSVLRRG